MLDIVITGGTVVLPSGAEQADLGIQGERIAALGAPGSLTQGAGRVVDATGQVVIPGGIDPHVHCNWPMPLPGQTEHQMTAGADVVSKAGLFGGTTTMIDFALVEQGETIQQALDRRMGQWQGASYGDWAFHVM